MIIDHGYVFYYALSITDYIEQETGTGDLI